MERPRRINAGKRRAEREDEAPKKSRRSKAQDTVSSGSLLLLPDPPVDDSIPNNVTIPTPPPVYDPSLVHSPPSRPPPRRHLWSGPLQSIDGNTRRVQLPDSFNGGPVVYTEPDSCSYEDIENIL
ncbi:hypothetical protein EJ04DRAFT_517728 [Polyplosphaeria fusca]|uniref:Uncharacterized protein n=1 Tax=Polyplosphaeria fusca TaxID=682080 RepID=A0A9P4UVY5_9PLEO|nr:hypothetical protein EJ04DRAFT_517728 [Polyplosphaeria fusca]